MRFSRLQAGSRPQVRHRPQSDPSPFPLPRPLPFPCPSQANFQVTQIDFARKFMRTLLHICEYVHQPEPSRAAAREGASASVSAPAAVPDSFSQRIFRHVADKRSKAAPTSALRCLRLGPLYLPPCPVPHASCYVFYLEQLPDEMPGLLLSRSRPGCPATRTRLAAKGQLMVLCDKQLLP